MVASFSLYFTGYLPVVLLALCCICFVAFVAIAISGPFVSGQPEIDRIAA